MSPERIEAAVVEKLWKRKQQVTIDNVEKGRPKSFLFNHDAHSTDFFEKRGTASTFWKLQGFECSVIILCGAPNLFIV